MSHPKVQSLLGSPTRWVVTLTVHQNHLQGLFKPIEKLRPHPEMQFQWLSGFGQPWHLWFIKALQVVPMCSHQERLVAESPSFSFTFLPGSGSAINTPSSTKCLQMVQSLVTLKAKGVGDCLQARSDVIRFVF